MNEMNDMGDEDGMAAGEEEHCPYCGHVNVNLEGRTCEHLCGWRSQSHFETVNAGRTFAEAWQDFSRFADTCVDGAFSGFSFYDPDRAGLVDAVERQLSAVDVMVLMAAARTGSGRTEPHALEDRGCRLYVEDPTRLSALSQECANLVSHIHSLMVIAKPEEGKRERPADGSRWHLVASGWWERGHVAYYVANVGSGHWLLDCVVPRAEGQRVIDIVTAAANAAENHYQVLWKETLEEGQGDHHHQIVAECTGASPTATASEIGTMLYCALCRAGGKEICEFDDTGRLLLGRPPPQTERILTAPRLKKHVLR